MKTKKTLFPFLVPSIVSMWNMLKCQSLFSTSHSRNTPQTFQLLPHAQRGMAERMEESSLRQLSCLRCPFRHSPTPFQDARTGSPLGGTIYYIVLRKLLSKNPECLARRRGLLLLGGAGSSVLAAEVMHHHTVGIPGEGARQQTQEGMRSEVMVLIYQSNVETKHRSECRNDGATGFTCDS